MTCERCGKKKKALDNFVWGWSNVERKSLRHYVLSLKNLCPNCLEEIKKFLREKKEVKNDS